MEFFENATLYSEFSDFQKRDAYLLFKECLSNARGQLDNCEVVLDVGCGTGETFFEFMNPSLKQKRLKVVGFDKSKEMVEFARKKYGSKDQSFHVYDIQSGLENIDAVIMAGSFDLVTCSYCYQWVKDEAAALFNIHRLLKPGGFCFMIFPVYHIFYKACEEQAEVEKFKSFVKLEDFLTRHYYSNNPVAELKNRLEDAGFGIHNLELRKLNFTFPSLKHLASSFKAIIPFKMPDAVKEEFVAESVQLMTTMDDLNHVSEDGGLNFSYELMVVLVSKQFPL